jgi:uncharacterized protein (UPF0276 family)
MKSPELHPIDEFDLITAPLEIEYVTEELGTHELIIRDYPRLARIFNETKCEILIDPTSFLVSSIETQIMTEREYPVLAKIFYKE